MVHVGADSPSACCRSVCVPVDSQVHQRPKRHTQVRHQRLTSIGRRRCLLPPTVDLGRQRLCLEFRGYHWAFRHGGCSRDIVCNQRIFPPRAHSPPIALPYSQLPRCKPRQFPAGCHKACNRGVLTAVSSACEGHVPLYVRCVSDSSYDCQHNLLYHHWNSSVKDEVPRMDCCKRQCSTVHRSVSTDLHQSRHLHGCFLRLHIPHRSGHGCCSGECVPDSTEHCEHQHHSNHLCLRVIY
mmetsp:Transcript_31624/g.51035  ORF Transcript_31624/g.51035 Transcript_31624/m.51035 type:complete len:239 (-) Transcript_31624:1237-1953(-)